MHRKNLEGGERLLTSYDKNYLRIGLPAALEGVLMIFLSNADIIMVGSLGTAAIAAVSIFTQRLSPFWLQSGLDGIGMIPMAIF